MKKVIYTTSNDQAQLVQEGDVLIVRYRGHHRQKPIIEREGRAWEAQGRYRTMTKSKMSLLAEWIKWVDYNFVVKPQGVHCSPEPK